MINKREKFSKLVSNEKSNTLQNLKERKKNRAMLRESKNIAFKVLLRIKELGWKQKDLAEKLEVSPQQVTKIVSGKENLTIDTLVKLQAVLDIPLLFSYAENKINAFEDTHKVEIKQDYAKPGFTICVTPNTPSVVKMTTAQNSNGFDYYPLAQ